MKPIGSFSTINNFEPSIGASNYIAIVQDYDHYDQTINLIIQYMPKHPLFNAFNSVEYLVPLSVIQKGVFSTQRPSEDLEQVHFKLVNDSTAILTKKKFLDTINLRIPVKTVFKNPSNEENFKYVYKIGYQSKLKGVADFKKSKLPTVWQFLCLSGRTGGADVMGKHILDILWSFFTNEQVDNDTISFYLAQPHSTTHCVYSQNVDVQSKN